MNILDGDLAMPVIYDRALSADEIAARYRDQGLTPATGDNVLACWPLAEERGESVADCSGHGRDGRIVNSATWMIGGPSFDGNQVPRFGDYDPAQDPQRGHGLRFASDDLYDCRWQVTHEYAIPKTAKPGLYVGRFRFTIDGQPRMYHATFVVRRAADRAAAPAPRDRRHQHLAGLPRDAVRRSRRRHCIASGIAAASPTARANRPRTACIETIRRACRPIKSACNTPWPNAGPYVLYSAESVGYSHLMRAERFALVWLEQNGYEYDMVGDLDVHRNPQAARRVPQWS